MSALEQQLPPSVKEILTAYTAKGNGDKDVLLAILQAKTAEDQRITALATLNDHIIQLQRQALAAASLQQHLQSQQQQQQQQMQQPSSGPSGSRSHYTPLSPASSSSRTYGDSLPSPPTSSTRSPSPSSYTSLSSGHAFDAARKRKMQEDHERPFDRALPPHTRSRSISSASSSSNATPYAHNTPAPAPVKAIPTPERRTGGRMDIHNVLTHAPSSTYHPSARRPRSSGSEEEVDELQDDYEDDRRVQGGNSHVRSVRMKLSSERSTS